MSTGAVGARALADPGAEAVRSMFPVRCSKSAKTWRAASNATGSPGVLVQDDPSSNLRDRYLWDAAAQVDLPLDLGDHRAARVAVARAGRLRACMVVLEVDHLGVVDGCLLVRGQKKF